MAPGEPGVAGTTLAHYRIIGPLGEGGMGRVFAAEDTRLERKVALKMLPAEWASDREWRQRFVREAKLLAGLNHPGIVTVYSVEKLTRPVPDWLPELPGGHHFITMELVDGRRLDQVIPAEGLPPERFFDLSHELLEAMAAAHEKGVVHRDLKPANVMVTASDRVKVLDFGLAKPDPTTLAEADEGAPTEIMTRAGEMIGTVGYMAPEQVCGQAVDLRTDVFALGLLLFQMATGRRPFGGLGAAERISAVLRDDAPRLEDLRSDYPRRLGLLIERCLEKTPVRRPRNALELRDELEAIRRQHHADTETGLRSIAVLAFADMSAGKDQEYLCEGLAEELINALNRVDGLRVASRAASFQFRDASLDIREIGRWLKVDAILEGSVRKAGDRLRITAELVDVANGYDLWSKRFDRTLSDVFAIQEEIAHCIVDALRVSLSADEQRRIGRSGTRVADAFDLYLRGRRFFYNYDNRGMEFALEMYRRAIDHDAGFARAHAGIADCHSYLFANAGHSEQDLESALAASRRALELDAELAEAHVARAVALSYGDRAAEAEEAFAKAIRADPRLFEAHYFYARHCFVQGRPEAAIEHYARAEALRPDDYQSPLLTAQVYEDVGRPDEATQARRRGVRLAEERLRFSPDDIRALYMAANALVVLGEPERGLEMARRARRLEPDDPMVLYNVACIYSLAGELEEALDCLEACLAHGFSYRGWAEQDSNLDAIREHPRYRELMGPPQGRA